MMEGGARDGVGSNGGLCVYFSLVGSAWGGRGLKEVWKVVRSSSGAESV